MRPLLVLLTLLVALPAAADLTPELTHQLADAKYVYIQSERKSGEWSRPAEIWFFMDGGKLYVGTRPTSWRVRRIRAGRTKARIAVGSAEGPTFEATGAVVRDPAVEARLLAAYAKKYPEGWAKFEQSFRDGFESGERVLVQYTPR